MLNPLNFISKLSKFTNQKELDRIKIIINKINLLEEKTKTLNDEDFPKKNDRTKRKD